MPRKPNPNRPRYATMIADARIKARLTQSELGSAIGKEASSIKKYEGGKVAPPFDVLYDICSVLNLDIFEVMDLDIRQGNSAGFHEFIDEPYNDLLKILNKDVAVVPLTGEGYTDNDIEVNYGNDYRGQTTKIEFLLKATAIKRRLKEEYQKKLSAELSKYAIQIAQNK